MKKTGVLLVIIAILISLIGVMSTLTFNLYQISFDMHGQESVVREYGGPYIDPEVTAYRSPVLMPFYKKELYVSKFMHLDVNKMGEQEIEYHRKIGNKEETAIRKVTVEDHKPPVITLITDPEYYTLPDRKSVV